MITKTIELKSPILWHDKTIREIAIREPGWKDVEALGYPSEVMQSGDTLSMATFPSVIAAYADRCLQPAGEGHMLALLGLGDTLAVHEAILSFFREARAVPSQNSGGNSPAPSSSTTASA